jgi:hypothetical protein
MKVTSPADELEVSITGASVEGESVVFDADIGVWVVRISVEPRDLRFFLSMLFRADVLLLILKRLIPFRSRPS